MGNSFSWRMPWKTQKPVEQKWDLVQQMRLGEMSVSELCRRFGISRKTAYKWVNRYRKEQMAGLRDRSRKPQRLRSRTSGLWLQRIRQKRRRHPTWGARKLHWKMALDFGKRGLPSVSSISRWLKRWNLVRATKKRRKAGPLVLGSLRQVPRRPNDVWTVDFKGWFRTTNKDRCEPLTVRDLYTRYVLSIRMLEQQNIRETRREFQRIFNKYGLPKRIRSDNGSPFGGGGPTGLTRLSAWWIMLGIEVEYITPGRPDENGAHEQFHGVYKDEQTRRLSNSRLNQQRRANRWMRQYNRERPHESLKMRPPAELYRPSKKFMPRKLARYLYRPNFQRKWVKASGEISLQGRHWFVGEAFARQYVGLKRLKEGIWEVYFCHLLIGELHRSDTSNSIRPARYRRHR